MLKRQAVTFLVNLPKLRFVAYHAIILQLILILLISTLVIKHGV